jgi:hypothetical protein
MRNTANKLLVAAAYAYSMNAAAAVYCPAPFDFKGVQNGVMYGDCSCNGQRLSNMTRQQCDAAVAQLVREQNSGDSPQSQAAQQSIYRPGSMMSNMIAARRNAASVTQPAQ